MFFNELKCDPQISFLLKIGLEWKEEKIKTNKNLAQSHKNFLFEFRRQHYIIGSIH